MGEDVGQDAHPDIALAVIEVVDVGVEGWGGGEDLAFGEEVPEPNPAGAGREGLDEELDVGAATDLEGFLGFTDVFAGCGGSLGH